MDISGSKFSITEEKKIREMCVIIKRSIKKERNKSK